VVSKEDDMRRIFPILIGLLVAACAPSPPDIDVALAYDMGTVVKGELAVAELSVRNLGEDSLIVEAVSTSCGCTKATLTPMVIPPGNEARLRVEYDSAVHEEDFGPIERYVFISSDDPDEEDVQIKLTVVVAAES
jgi:Protein of unknown function (DUF1573)